MVNLKIRTIGYKSAAATARESDKEEAVKDVEEIGYIKRKKGLAERGRELMERARPAASAAAGVVKGGVGFLTGGMIDGEVRRKRPARDSGGFDMFDFGGSSQKRSSGGGLDITNIPDPFSSSGGKRAGSKRNMFADPFEELMAGGTRVKKKRKKRGGEIHIHIHR